MVTDAKTLHIVAGPNGSGKTTFAESYFVGIQNHPIFLNPDLIASGIAPGDSEGASFHAGRILLAEIKQRINQGESFSFESTLSGKTWIPILKDARDRGYKTFVYFLFLDSVERNLERVKNRVLLGGHSIPPDAIVRRHPRCFANFWNLYRPLCSDWYMFNNSKPQPLLVQDKRRYEGLSSFDQSEFAGNVLKGLPNG